MPDRQPAAAPPARQRRITRQWVAGGLVLLAGWVAWDYLPALAWAVLIAVAVWPLHARLDAAWPGHRALSAGVLTAAALLGVLLPVGLVVLEVGREAQTALRWLEQAQQSGIPAPDWLAGIPLLGRVAQGWWRGHLADAQHVQETFQGIDRTALAAWSQSLGGEVLHRGLLLLVTAMALYRLLRDGDRIAAHFGALVERMLGDPGDRLAEKLTSAVRGTVVGTIVVAAGEGVLIGAGYVWAGVPHALLFGVLTAACAMLPLGAWIAFSAAALTLLASGGSGVAAGAVFGWGAAVMLAGDNFVQPAMIGGATRLPFLWALIGILGGVGTLGLVGLFLGPVLMAAVQTVWEDWLDRDLPPRQG